MTARSPSLPSTLGVTALALALTACGDDPGDADWRYGPAVDYPVDASGPLEIPDPVAGGTFYLPGGGRGTLTVAPIRSGPLPLLAGATSFAVTWTGAEPLELHLPRPPDALTSFHIAGEPTYSTYEPVPEAGAWLPIAPDPAGDTWVFPLSRGATPTERARLQTASTTMHCASVTLALTSPSVLQLQIYDARLQSTLESLVLMLSPTLQTSVRAAMQAPPLQLHDTVIAADVNAYNASQTGLWGYGKRTLKPHFQFVVTGKNLPSASTFAHEAGHYLSHLVVGDAAFQSLEAQRQRVHDLGVPDPARPMLEEYAQLADQLSNGKVRLAPLYNLAEPLRTFREVTIRPTVGPKELDWPALEGYGAALMTNLMRTSPTLAEGISGGPEDIPAFSLTAADVFGMIAQHKPLTVDQLRESAHLYLGQTMRNDALPALLERTGWSYHARGRLVDAQGNGVAGAQIQAVCKAPSQGREYVAPLTPATTDAQGHFELERLFPGGSTLRVTVGPTTRDLLTYAEPTDPTTKRIELDPIVWSSTPTFGKLAVQIEAVRDWNRIVGGDITPGSGIVDNLRWLDQVEVRSLTASDSVLAASLRWSFAEYGTGYEHALELDCTLGTQGELAHCALGFVLIERYEGGATGERRAQLSLDTIARTTDRPDERAFSCSGLACQEHLTIVSETFIITDAAGTALLRYEHLPGSIAWDDPFTPARVLLRLTP